MSCKKKHKPNKNLNKIKQNRIESKHRYFAMIYNLCGVAGCEKCFLMIPKEELERLFRRRLFPPRIIVEPGLNIPEPAIKKIKECFTFLIEHRSVDIDNNDNQITLLETITIVIPFLSYLNDLKGNEFETALQVKKLLEKYKPVDEILTAALWELFVSMAMAGYEASNFNGKIYWLKHDFKLRTKVPALGIENIISINEITPGHVNVCMDGKNRPAYKLCWWDLYTGMKTYYVSYKELEINKGNPDEQLGIYIQEHAIQRIKERLDCVTPMIANVLLASSLNKMNIRKFDEDYYFIEFTIKEIKVGYLVSKIIDNKLVILTFLFITQNGTPEGDKLSRLYGLAKIDKSYIALDKLSTYVYTDLCINSNLKEIFDSAGCQYLLDIYSNKIIRSLCIQENVHSRAEELIKFFGLNKENKDFIIKRKKFTDNFYKRTHDEELNYKMHWQDELYS